MSTDLEVSHVLHLRVCFIVKAEEFFDEISIVSVQLFTVLLEVQDGSGFALYLVYIKVVDSGNLIGSLCSLSTFTLVLLLCLCLFLGSSQSGLDAEGIVTALRLPELLKLFPFNFLEGKLLLLNAQLSIDERGDQFIFDS